MQKLRRVACVLLPLFAAGCGCAASPEKKAEGTGTTPSAEQGRREAWGASFVLSPEWTGGANESGGFEYTDGDLALLVGHHSLTPDQALESFLDDRDRSLREMGASGDLIRGSETVGRAQVLTSRGSAAGDGGGLELRLLVARLSPNEGLSLLMIADTADAARMDAAWARLQSSLRLP